VSLDFSLLVDILVDPEMVATTVGVAILIKMRACSTDADCKAKVVSFRVLWKCAPKKLKLADGSTFGSSMLFPCWTTENP
jgi:hypothetical protein